MTFEPWAVNMGVSVQSVTVPMDAEHVIRQHITDYTGAYNITPTAEAQVLNIRGMRATDDITVGPIPSNYGLISWNGSVLTVF